MSDLNGSATSIQQLSLWLIHHRKHYQLVVKTWFKQLAVISNQKKLAFLYLANDVVQNSKKKYPEYSAEFGRVMKKVMEHLSVIHLDESTVKGIGRLLKIWQERSIFDPKIQTDLNRIWATKSLEMTAASMEPAEAPASKKARKESPSKSKKKIRVSFSKSPKSTHSGASNDDSANDMSLASDSDAAVSNQGDKSSSDLLHSLLNSNENSPKDNPDKNDTNEGENSHGDPPDPEELIQALQDLENAASSELAVREQIAELPSEVSEVSHFDELKSPEEGKTLLGKVEQATELLSTYNVRLQQELKDRKRVGKMIADFLTLQKDLEAQAEERLEQYRDKLDKVNAVREDLRSHISSLPDLTKLPDVTGGGLAPLPSAGDLFTLK